MDTPGALGDIRPGSRTRIYQLQSIAIGPGATGRSSPWGAGKNAVTRPKPRGGRSARRSAGDFGHFLPAAAGGVGGAGTVRWRTLGDGDLAPATLRELRELRATLVAARRTDHIGADRAGDPTRIAASHVGLLTCRQRGADLSATLPAHGVGMDWAELAETDRCGESGRVWLIGRVRWPG